MITITLPSATAPTSNLFKFNSITLVRYISHWQPDASDAAKGPPYVRRVFSSVTRSCSLVSNVTANATNTAPAVTSLVARCR